MSYSLRTLPVVVVVKVTSCNFEEFSSPYNGIQSIRSPMCVSIYSTLGVYSEYPGHVLKVQAHLVLSFPYLLHNESFNRYFFFSHAVIIMQYYRDHLHQDRFLHEYCRCLMIASLERSLFSHRGNNARDGSRTQR